MYQIIEKRKIWLGLSGFLVFCSLVSLSLWGLNFGIDFTGGSLLEVVFNNERPGIEKIEQRMADLNLSSLTIQPVAERGMILRFQETDEEKHQEVLKRLDTINDQDAEQVKDGVVQKEGEGISVEGDGLDGLEISINEGEKANYELTNIEELRFDSVGPSIGEELKQKSVYAIFFVLLAIILYIAWAFRAVSKPVASWKYGLAAIFALFHDVIVVLGAFAFIGKYYNIEINTPFVAAILTVLGYSVNDTIVVFDRIRENLPKSDDDFSGTVNISVNQTIRRSINTSITTLIVLLSIFFYGGETIRSFVLALSIGVFIGTYSSIFLASPVLTIFERFKKS